MMKVVRDKIFEEPKFEIIRAYHRQASQTVKKMLHCYHIAKVEEPTEDNPRNI
jgi:hypothetical protein